MADWQPGRERIDRFRRGTQPYRRPPKGPDGKRPRICSWCGGPLPTGRRSWCSDACVEDHGVRSGRVAGLLFRRDAGICAVCRMARTEFTGEGRVYSYGANEPITNLDLVREQLRLGHRYRNRLTELERARRERVEAALVRLGGEFPLERIGLDIQRAEEELLVLVRQEKDARAIRGDKVLRKTRGEGGGRSEVRVPDADRAAAIRNIKARLRILRAERKKTRGEAFASPPWVAAQKNIDDQDRADRKTARAASGLYSGTADEIDDAARAQRRGPPPRFKRWDGSGRLCVRKSNGVATGEVLAGERDSFALVLPGDPNFPDLPDGYWEEDGAIWLAGSRRAKRLGDAVVMISVAAGRRTIVPIHYHRLLPLGTVVKRIRLHCSRVGTHTRWEVQLIVAAPDAAPFRDPRTATTGRVGIDVGWRCLPVGRDGPPMRIRVAVWSGSDGEEGELCLPGRWLGEMRVVEGIRSERDRLRNEALALVVPYASRLPAGVILDPERERIGQWKSSGRLAALVLRWRQLVEEGRWEIPRLLGQLEDWRVRDRHLVEYETQLRDQLLASRREIYRTWAAEFSRRYAVAVIEAMDLRAFHRLPGVEDAGGMAGDACRIYTRDAALSKLREAVAHRFREVIKLPAAGTTMRCHLCGAENGCPPAHPALVQACNRCGRAWDQDLNAARNMLIGGDWEEREWSDPLAPTATWDTSRSWTDRKRAKEVKAEALAREAEKAYTAGVS